MEAGDDEAEPGAGFDFGESAAFEEGEVGGGPGGGIFAADEIPVLATDDDGAQNAFGLVVVDGEVAARGVDGEALPTVEEIHESLVRRAGFIVARECVGAGTANAVKNRGSVAKASLLPFCVVRFFRVAFEGIEFPDPVEDIFRDEVALFCRDDKATAYMRPTAESDDAGRGSDGVVRAIAVRHPVREEPPKRVAWFYFFSGIFSRLSSGIIIRARQAQHFPQLFRTASADVKEHLIASDPAPDRALAV